MTIRTQLTNIAVFLASLLTAIRGALLYFVLRFGSVEFSAPIATESTPSNSRDTMPVQKSKTPSPSLPTTMISKYEGPQDKLAAIVHGEIDLADVSLAEWIQLVTIHMASDQSTHLNVDIPYKGGLYLHHHCIEKIQMPKIGPVWETRH